MAINYDKAKGGYTDGATTWSPNSDGTIGVDEAGYVASVNNIRYKSLADAIAAAGAGGTVTLIDDVTLSSKLVLNQAQVFDLNGFTLDGAVSLSGEADVTFQNGKMTAAYSSTTSNSYSVVQVNGSSVLTLDGVTLTPADSSNRSQATHAIVYQSTGALNIKNSTVAGGNLVHDKNYTSGTNQAACAIYAYGNSAGTIQIEESTITGGAGKTDAEYDGTYKSGLYVEGGEAIKLGGSAAITINSSTVTGGASDWYNAADAVNVTNTFSGTLNIENASKISGGDALNLSGETSRGIGGAGIYTNQSTSCTEIVVTDSEIEGGNGGHSWNGSALELNTSAPEVTITNSTLTVGQGENSSGNAGAIRVNNTNTIDLNLNGVTLDGAGNANQVFQITSNVSNGGISLAGENTISGGTLENVTFIEVAEGTTITTTGDGKVDPVTVLNPVSTPVYDETTGAYVFEPVETSTATLLVNSNWASLPDGTAVQYDGANYRLGFNAFGDMNTAVSSIDRSYVLGDTFKEPITIEMTDATSDKLNLYGMNLVLTGNLTSSGSWNTALVASPSSDPNYITYLKLDNARIKLTGDAALEGVNWGKAAVSFDKEGNIVASADQTIQRGTIVELVNGTVFDADNQVNGRGVFFKIDGTSQIYQYGTGNALITMTSGAIVDGGQSTAGDYTSVNQIDARWIYFGKGSSEWEGIYGDKTYFTFRNGANVEAKDRIEFGTGSLLKEMDVEIEASKIVATNNMIIGTENTENNAGKITSFVVSNNSLLQAGTDLSIVGTTVELSNSTLNAATVTLTDGKLNVTGNATLAAEFMAAGTGLLNLNSVAFGSGTSVNDTASYTNNTIGSEIVMTGTNTLTDGAFVSTGWSKNFRLGYNTGTESDSLEITGGATLKVGGNSYIGSAPEDKGASAYQVTVSGAGSSFAGSGAGGDLYLRRDGRLTVKDDASASFSYADIKGSVILENGNFSFIDSRLIGTITMDYASTLTFSGEINSAGEAITIDMTDFSGGVYKLIDYTGNNSYTEEQYKALLAEGNWNDNFVIINKDLYAANADTSTLKVNTAWKNTEIGTEVEEGFYYGFNAFDTLSTTIANITNNTTNISIAASDYAGSADAEFTQGVAIDSNGAKFDNMWSFGVNSDTAAEFNPETAEKFTVSGELTVGQFYAEKNANVYVVIDGDLTTVGSFGAKLATQLDINGSVTVTPPENGAAQVMVYGTMNVTGTLDSTSGPMAAVMLIGNDRYDTEYGKGGVLNVTGDNASVTLRGNTDSDMPVLISGLSSLNLSDGATFTHENGSIENKGTINVASSTLTVGVALENSGTVNVSGTSTVEATIDGAVNLLDDTDVTFKGGAKDLLVESGAEVTLRGELSGNEVVYEKGYKYNAGGAQGITVNIASGEGTTFQSYAWYASNGSIYNVKTGSTAEITYANINATGTINVDEGATLTVGRESSNILGTLNVNGTLNSVMTVYAGYTDGAQAGLVNITGTANSSIVTIGTAVRDDDKYNAAAAEGANTTASIVVNGGTFNATGQEGELTSKLFVGSTEYAGTLSAVNGTINVGARSADGTGYMRFLIGEKGALNLDNSTLTVYNLGGTNNSGEGVFQNSGTINMDLDSQIVTATALENSGTITVDMTGAAKFGVYKLIDYTGSDETAYGNVKFTNNGYEYTASVFDNDLYLVREDGAKELYVNSAWQSAAAYKEVTFVDETTAYYGLNAFDTVDNAVKSLSANDPILLNVTGGVEAITVVGTSVTEVNASAKTADITKDSVIDTDAIVVNLVEIDNTDAGWQVYYPLASGSNAQVYGNITTNFLSTTFTYEGERTGDPNFSGAGYAGTTATVYGNTTVNIGEADADDTELKLNTGFLLGAGGGTVNGSSSLNINSGTIAVDAIVGGGAWRGQVKGDSSVTISGGVVSVDTDPESTGRAIFGGSYGNVNYNPDDPDAPSATGGNASVIINGDAQVTGKIIGGSEGTNVKNSLVDISGEAQVTGNVFGGGNRGGQVKENAAVTIADSAVLTGNVYGGGFGTDTTDSIVQGSTSVTLSGGTVTGNVYAGGSNSSVAGDAAVTLTGGTVGGDVYGSGEGSGTVAGASTLNVGAADAAFYTTTLNNVYDFDLANITNAAVTVDGVFAATQISIADSALTLNSGFDTSTTTVSIEVGAFNAENAALVLDSSAVGTAPAISISGDVNALTEARYLVATGFDDLAAFSLEESLAEDYLLRAVDGNIYLYNADAPYFTTELSVTQAEGASVDGNYTFTANFEAEGLLLTGYTLKLYDSATATTPIDEITLGADVVGQEFTFANTVQNFWISVTANGENGQSTDSPTSGRLEVAVQDHDSPVILSVTSDAKSDSVTLACEATDNFGVTGYEFILDGQSLGVQSGSQLALDISNLAAGTHSYTVNVYDAAGNLAGSAEQSFEFTPAPGPGPEPTVPASFLYSSQVRVNNGETVTVYANYSNTAAVLEYRIGDTGDWLTYDATTGVNVSSSTTVYFREQGITDPVETAVDVTVVPADVELNAEVILLAPTTDTTYEVIYNFADGGSKAVELSGNSVEHYALPENTTVTIVEKDASGEVVNTIVEETPAASTTAEIPDKVVAVDDGHDNLFFAMPVGQWGTGIAAQHLGDGTWGGTLEIVSLTGKNRFSTVFTGSDDATTLFLTDDANGDVFFLDDIYTANGSDARIRKMSEIQAGAGDDIVDLTSARFAYEEHASKQLTVRGGDGNDILWGNAGHNIMFGDDGNDRIYGGSDNDVLIGGTGNDTMLGGGGDDIFCYGSSFDWGSDTITQLSGGTVTLYLDGIDRNDCSISGSTLTWNDGTHTGSITLNGVSWDSVKFYCAANGDGDLTKQSDYEELKNKGAFAAISSH